ncbi:uncharacterized protein SCHCODRAFT_01123179 [Schizophyllum commune H4-8]|uniref:uncharacterized protein n=1 Tax=Schizophyllum commune (strain H4-8 / FGSC 9210) TaxID=578458 RepID=UPI00215F96BE|nr:uncharacterized protein SCHCODRAFT_01123179 [Schizophyllum commune H4-8]KAI5896357.1 hypothetical protein SCHCODRAFT_01123179 [Schizophyllum commune H4-8]
MTGLAVVGLTAYPAIKATAAAAAHLPLSRCTAGRTPFKPSRRTRLPCETDDRHAKWTIAAISDVILVASWAGCPKTKVTKDPTKQLKWSSTSPRASQTT